MKPRIVILGGSGFIGSALIERFLREGYAEIASISATRPAQDLHIESHIARLNDRVKLGAIIRGGDIVIHAAGVSSVRDIETNPEYAAAEEFDGTRVLLEVCEQKVIQYFIYVSSGGMVYGSDTRTPAKESDQPEPKNAYGKLKLSIEALVEAFAQHSRVSTLIVRLANPYGRTNTAGRSQGALDIFLARVLALEPVTVYGKGEIVRDYVHIDDVASFFVHAISHKLSGIYNVGSGTGASLNDLLASIEHITGITPTIAQKAAIPVDIPYAVVDISKAMASGWQPTFSLEDGIRDIYRKQTTGA